MIHDFSTLSSSLNRIRAIYDEALSFEEYIIKCQHMIATVRPQLHRDPTIPFEQIVNANSPFEYRAITHSKMNQKNTSGALLIHGLFDSPFSMRDIAYYLQQNGFLTRSILLPGHGTHPEDLLSVRYQDWIKAVQYGVESFHHEVDHLFLVGFSTGATLSIYHALNDKKISGLILLSPAVKLKPLVHTTLQYCPSYLMQKDRGWFFRHEEFDYTKYCSIPVNPVMQLLELSNHIAEAAPYSSLSTCPVFMALSQEDKTISTRAACRFFYALSHPQSKLLLYAAHPQKIKQGLRMMVRETAYPSLHIQHFSHVCLPFMPNNTHYGQQGDYQRLLLKLDPQQDPHQQDDIVYGDYHFLDMRLYHWLYRLQLCKTQRYLLTFNPDFHFMMEAMLIFMQGVTDQRL